MLRKIILSFCLILFIGNALDAQRVWSLERCLKHVETSNSPTIRLAKIDVDRANVENRRQKARRQPTLNVASDLGLNLGRADDPVTGTYENQSILYNTLFLQGNYNLFDGNRTKNEIARSEIDIEVAEAEEEQLAQDMTLEVLQAYLSILLAEEHLENAKQNLQQTNDWYAQMEKKVRGGIYSKSDLRTVEIQQARDEQTIIDRENFVNKNYVALKILLEMDPSQPLKIKKPDNITFAKLKKLPFSRVYNKALKTQPALKIGDLKMENAKLEEAIARGSKKPTVSLFGTLWTSYSSATTDTDPDQFEVQTGRIKNAFIPNVVDNEDISFPDTVFTPFNKIYPNQIIDNLGLGVGVRLNIPILDQKASQLDAEIAHLNMKRAQEENNQLKRDLKANIQNAIHDVEAATNKLAAVEKTYRLSEEAVDFMRKKLAYGNVGAFELKLAMDERDDVQTELVIAKYDYVLKKMIIDYYEGKDLKL